MPTSKIKVIKKVAKIVMPKTYKKASVAKERTIQVKDKVKDEVLQFVSTAGKHLKTKRGIAVAVFSLLVVSGVIGYRAATSKKRMNTKEAKKAIEAYIAQNPNYADSIAILEQYTDAQIADLLKGLQDHGMLLREKGKLVFLSLDEEEQDQIRNEYAEQGIDIDLDCRRLTTYKEDLSDKKIINKIKEIMKIIDDYTYYCENSEFIKFRKEHYEEAKKKFYQLMENNGLDESLLMAIVFRNIELAEKERLQRKQAEEVKKAADNKKNEFRKKAEELSKKNKAFSDSVQTQKNVALSKRWLHKRGLKK